MHKIWIAALIVSFYSTHSHAQVLPGVFRKGSKPDSVIGAQAGQLFGKHKLPAGLTAGEVAAGLKQALQIGTERATTRLSAADGYFANAAVKILMPAEAKKLESTLRSLGMGRQVDAAILSMNRAAELAAGKAAAIFVDAVKGMTITDAAGILKGGDNAATGFLKEKTSAALLAAFQPVIGQSLQQLDATRHWTTITTTYNTVSREKINTDLAGYVAEKAMAGIFLQLAQEEQKIRKDPAARTTELLKKVFQ